MPSVKPLASTTGLWLAASMSLPASQGNTMKVLLLKSSMSRPKANLPW